MSIDFGGDTIWDDLQDSAAEFNEPAVCSDQGLVVDAVILCLGTYDSIIDELVIVLLLRCRENMGLASVGIARDFIADHVYCSEQPTGFVVASSRL